MRAIFSYISLQNLSNDEHEKQHVCTARIVTLLWGSWINFSPCKHSGFYCLPVFQSKNYLFSIDDLFSGLTRSFFECNCHRHITAVTTNTRPQKVFSSVETCGLVDVNQPLPWFSRVGQQKILSPFL